jgi:hypothetical protein
MVRSTVVTGTGANGDITTMNLHLMHGYTSAVLTDATRDGDMDHSRHGVAEAVYRQRGPVARHRVRGRP